MTIYVGGTTVFLSVTYSETAVLLLLVKTCNTPIRKDVVRLPDCYIYILRDTHVVACNLSCITRGVFTPAINKA